MQELSGILRRENLIARRVLTIYGVQVPFTLPTSMSEKCVIGIIDANDALHYRILDENSHDTHDSIWPLQSHKRWRFWIHSWQLDTSVLSSDRLNMEDHDRIMKLVKSVIPVPRYERRLDAWESAGRPRGKKYDKWLDKWDKENPE